MFCRQWIRLSLINVHSPYLTPNTSKTCLGVSRNCFIHKLKYNCYYLSSNMSEKKGYPNAPQAPAGYVPAPPHPATPAAAAYAAATASPYAVYQQLYPGQAPPPYDQQLPAIMAQQMYPHVGVGTAMYSQTATPGYYASAFTPMQAYYPLAYTYPQPQLRPTIMIPNGYDGGARFDGIAAPVVPGPPPGVPPTPAQLAAMAGHNITLSQKKGSFLTGASEGGYTFW